MAQAKTLEESLEELNEVISKMDREDISLEESFKLYNQGVKLFLYFSNKNLVD